MTNRLGHETSPYLLQHRDNPVAWQPWDKAALAEATALDKPILLSIGYAACHWCHVMAHESFEHPEIAALLNDLFVPIKVDREERPDLDAIYQQALAMLGEQGGWPLTMFLTPAGEPYWGGTYFPPTRRWGRPGFPEVMAAAAEAYRQNRALVDRNVAAITDALRRPLAAADGTVLGPALLDDVAERLAAAHDPVHGGLKGAPKFPNCSILELLWRAWRRTGRRAYAEPVLLTLDRMSEGGIYDHLAGGFARYSTDERWLVPHFEKMLYDNAQLVSLLTEAWQETRSPLFARRVAETIAWLDAEMTLAEGAFAGTLDADSDHEEGAFYVWTEAEIDRVLSSDSALFKRAYDIGPTGNWDGKTILNRLTTSDLSPAEEDALTAARRHLLDARAGRNRPALDDKVLTDWNGLMIAALARASAAFDRPDWLALATSAWDFITTRCAAAPGRLVHSWRLGRTHPGTLDDHAAMAMAGLVLFEATGDDRYRAASIAWVETIERHFAARGGGYHTTPDDGELLIARLVSAQDGALPSGNGMLLDVLARLHLLTGEDRYRERAEALLDAFAGELASGRFGMAALLNGADTFWTAAQLVLIGERGRPDLEALIAATRAASSPALVVLVVADGSALPAQHPAHGRTMAAGRATTYLCRRQACSLPITDPAELARQLALPSSGALP